MRWAEPQWFWTLLAALPFWWRSRRRARLPWPSVERRFGGGPRGWAPLEALVPVLEILAIVALVAALARPQTVGGRTRIRTRGVALVVALDRSSSMNAVDSVEGGGPASSRIEAAKRVVSEFLAKRPNDLVGLVAFAGEPDLACPPTLDHRFVRDSLAAIRTAKASDDGTNLGDAIVWACDALRKSEAVSRRLILLSDGKHAPQVRRDHLPVDPIDAADLARELGIVVDTVAVGAVGGTTRRRDPELKVDIVAEADGPDVELLSRIATSGGGLSFHATDPEGLRSAFARIDAASRSTFEDTVLTRHDERFVPFAAAGVAAWFGVGLWRAGRGRRLP